MARKNIVFNFIRETYTELSRVVWPTRAEVFKKTILILSCMLVGAVVIGAFDLGLSEGLKALLAL